MRVDVKKFLFIGSEDEKDLFFKKAQQAGFIHFIESGPKEKTLPADIERVSAAIKILRGLPPTEQEENFDSIQGDDIVKRILDLNANLERLLEEQRVLNLEMARVRIFGDFSKEDVKYIEREAKCKVQFFCARPDAFDDLTEPEGLIYINSDHGLDYYLSINSEPVAYDKTVEIHIDQPLGELEKRYQEARQEAHDVERELKNYTKYNNFLHHVLLEKLNKYHLYTTQNYVQQAMGGLLFAIEGWVAVNQIDKLEALTERFHVHYEEVAIEPTDVVPTYLENKGLSKIGEDLIHIYDTPSPRDKDPSPWVFGFFILFFSFIIGDAGYGLVYLAIALFLRYKYPDLKGMKKRVLNLFTMLSIGCIFWGVLMTSIFGIPIAPDNPIRQISLIHWLADKKAAYYIAEQGETYQEWVQKYPELQGAQNAQAFLSYTPPGKTGHPILEDLSDGILFELAILVGVVHIILSLLRYIRRNWHGVGWILFLIGAYLYIPDFLDAPSVLNYVGGVSLEEGGRIGLQLMAGGFAFAWIGSLIINGLTGLLEFTTIIQLFADVLSYLRLYALALCGAIITVTINSMLDAFPFVIGIILFTLAHIVNMLLGIMSGVIHGLRLNFLEWYHYSFEGGGRQFQPLKLLKFE
jgi:V/A-type H+/Na+-transporting ATPase subunit I